MGMLLRTLSASVKVIRIRRCTFPSAAAPDRHRITPHSHEYAAVSPPRGAHGIQHRLPLVNCHPERLTVEPF